MRALVLACSLLATSTCFAQTTLVGASMQPGAPVHFVQTHYGMKDVFLGGTFVNHAERTVIRYRIGWVEVRDGEKSFHEGSWMTVPDGLAPGGTAEVPDQNVSMDTAVQRYLFFISELAFDDGTTWSADGSGLLQEAGAA